MMTSMKATRRIGLLTCDDPAQLDLVGPAEVFHEANQGRREQGQPAAYEIRVLHWRREPTPDGIWTQVPYGPERDLDTLLVCSGRKMAEALTDAELLEWLRRIAPRTRRVGSVCTGAFLLAAAGLLDGRRATTHWKHCATLAARYPSVQVESDPIFVRDGNIYTSAGSSAGMDLALALVEEDLGHQAALAVARELVMFLQRPGGQSQFSAQLAVQRAERQPLGDLQAWMADHPDADLSVEALARRAAMSPRNFARAFRRELGVTPAHYVDLLRVDTARRRLQESGEGVERIATDCGFGTAETMRRAFIRLLGIPPSEYRGRFCARA
jgi:transcriptional regulator GlxA family with amidase domain